MRLLLWSKVRCTYVLLNLAKTSCTLSYGLADLFVPYSGILILTPANRSAYRRWFFLLLKHNQLLNATIYHTRLADFFLPTLSFGQAEDVTPLVITYLLDTSGPTP